jgi:hypothetical protein
MTAPLTADELQRRLSRADPAALLVPPRLLRRVLKQHRHVGGLGLMVPHRKSCTLPRDALLALADAAEMGAAGRELPATVILLPLPTASALAGRPPELVLRKYWRLLFHARAHAAFAERGPLSDAALHNRIKRLGEAEFEEAKAVLDAEGFLLPPGDDRTAYEELAAVWLELRHFAPHLLPHFFPELDRAGLVDRVLADDVPDAVGLLARCRPEGAADPTAPEPLPDEEAEDDEAASVAAPPPALPAADDAAARGNVVRAALLRRRAGLAAADQLHALAARLCAAVGRPADVDAWQGPLRALLDLAARGFWNQSGRLLYDLQSACVDAEREVSAVDLVGWALTFGRRPLKRPLPFQGPVLLVKHLRRAAARVPATRLAEADRDALEGLLHSALHHAEEDLRHRLRPAVERALEEAGLRPVSHVERLARDKVAAELLDRIAEGGFLTMSQLRDALARNRLKLPDLSGPAELARGDGLLRADRNLAAALDGVYHRGDFYLRWLQSFSSLSFGTVTGRRLTLFVLLPLLGAVLLLEFSQYVVGHAVKFFEPSAHAAPAPPHEPAPESAAAPFVWPDDEEWADAATPEGLPPEPEKPASGRPDPHASHLHFLNAWSLPLTALFLLGVLHWPAFRALVRDLFRLVWRLVRGLLYDLPVGVLNWPPVRALRRSDAFLLLWQVLLKPALIVAPPLLLVAWLGVPTVQAHWRGWERWRSLTFGLRWHEVPWAVLRWWAAGAFAAVCLLLNSRTGQQLEEVLTDRVARRWHQVRTGLIPGLFRLIVGFFRGMLEALDRLVYTVDEWLRFRGQEGRLSACVKAVLAPLWGAVTYVLRFVATVLFEPQVNPIKHFPVVTVSHKMLFLALQPTAKFVAATLGLGLTEAVAATTAVFALIPGVFGFLAWELKENWRLYRANQPEELVPQVVGAHGEGMLQLLRPGFHSGTLPKLFAKLRRAERRGGTRTAGRQRAALHHAEEEVRRFVERELAALLRSSRAWGGLPLTVGRVAAGTNRVRVELAGPPGEALLLDFVCAGDALEAGVARAGWAASLTPPQKAALSDALVGLFKLAGAAVVRGSPAPFAALPLRWETWAARWERDQAGKGEGRSLLPRVAVLPA